MLIDITKLVEASIAAAELPRYAWPGGYPILYYDNEGNEYCADCIVGADIRDADSDSSEEEVVLIVEYGINWEDCSLYCTNCSKKIDCAYPTTEEEAERLADLGCYPDYPDYPDDTDYITDIE